MKTIFIASAPRSGSTWLGNIFNSHPDVIYRHEPIARLREKLQRANLLDKLKFNHSLTPDDKTKLWQILVEGNTDTNRPPFFPKKGAFIPPSMVHCLWGSTIVCPWLEGLFRKVNLLYSRKSSTLVIKETGWSIHLPSILDSMKPDHVIFLLRHPCAIFASIKRGISLDLMRRPTPQQKLTWLKDHKNTPFVRSSNITKRKILETDDAEFWAIKLRVMFELFETLLHRLGEQQAIYIIYENLVDNPLETTKEIFKFVNLDFTESVHQFLTISTHEKKSSLLPEKGSDFYSIYKKKNHNRDKWRQELSSQEINTVEQIVGKKYLNYFS